MKLNGLYVLGLIILLPRLCGFGNVEPPPSPTPTPLVADFGDAPDPTFPSLLASDGARTFDVSPFWLGNGATIEEDAQVVDLDPMDDGMVAVLVTAGEVRVTFEATRSETSQAGVVYFNLLADTNGDGRWQAVQTSEGPVQEWIVVNQAVQLAPGARERITAKFPLVGGNLEAWVRATLTDSKVTASDWDGTGRFDQGEVEDHRIGPTDLWDVECKPKTLVIPHDQGGVIDLVVNGPTIPTTMEVVAVTGPATVLGDPNANDITVDPSVADGEEPFGQISVQSWRVHGFPGMSFGVDYGIEVMVKAPLGVKTVNCLVRVIHEAPDDLPAAISTEEGYRIVYGGPMRVQSGGILRATFQITGPDGQPAQEEFRATLGNPPTHAMATHGVGQPDEEGFVLVELEVKWPAGTTKLFCAFRGRVYEVGEIDILGS